MWYSSGAPSGFCRPSGVVGSGHQVVKRGVTLMEHLSLSQLAADGCHEFLFTVGALPVTGAAGSPINPIAIG